MALVALLSAGFFGTCLSSWVLFVPGGRYRWQLLASAVKVPCLLLLSMVGALAPTQLLARLLRLPIGLTHLLRIQLASVASMAVFLASAGLVIVPCSATRNYSIVVLLSYAVFIAAGIAGTVFFFLLLRRTCNQPATQGTEAAARTPPRRCGATRMAGLALGWSTFVGLAGAELGWSMRPFVGWSGESFSLFRSDGMKMHEQVYYELQNLLRGGSGFPNIADPRLKAPAQPAATGRPPDDPGSAEGR